MENSHISSLVCNHGKQFSVEFVASIFFSSLIQSEIKIKPPLIKVKVKQQLGMFCPVINNSMMYSTVSPQAFAQFHKKRTLLKNR